jgi:hypothetical protein
MKIVLALAGVFTALVLAMRVRRWRRSRPAAALSRASIVRRGWTE